MGVESEKGEFGNSLVFRESRLDVSASLDDWESLMYSILRPSELGTLIENHLYWYRAQDAIKP